MDINHYAIGNDVEPNEPNCFVNLANSALTYPTFILLDSAFFLRVSKLRKSKWIKLSVGADMLKQIICIIKRAPHARLDNIDFKPIITRGSEIKPISVAVVYKSYNSEENHVLVREHLKAYSIIPSRNVHVLIWRMHGKYRK